jgi:hypothetical protein
MMRDIDAANLELLDSLDLEPEADLPAPLDEAADDERPARKRKSRATRSKRRRKGDDDEDGERQDSQATVLVELALASGAELYHDAGGDAYATVPIGAHQETWRVRSKSCKLWLWGLYHQHQQRQPNAQAVADALCGLESRALFDGGEHAVHIRTAEHAGKVYIDLCDDAWRAVEVDDDGWRVVTNPPVRFRRAKAMLALPTPVNGGRLDELRDYVNVDGDGWTLAAAWLVAAARPRGPYPLLALTAEQGAGKSTVARLLRSVIDPSTAPIRCEPRDPRDLMIAASNGWCVALDNLSYVETWLSDALCRLATGGGFGTRTLYTDDEEHIFDAMRPVVLTGIEDYVSRGDLLDRSLIVPLPAIPEHKRRPEAELWHAWERDRPRIFGALLTAISTALARLPDMQLERLPRMADFALWSTAAEPALGIASGEFIATYTANRQSANSMVLDDSLVACTLRHWMQDHAAWEGTAAFLLAELSLLLTEHDQRSKRWPKSPRGLSGHLRRLAPSLRHVGIDVAFERVAGGTRTRTIRVERRDGGDG